MIDFFGAGEYNNSTVGVCADRIFEKKEARIWTLEVRAALPEGDGVMIRAKVTLQAFILPVYLYNTV